MHDLFVEPEGSSQWDFIAPSTADAHAQWHQIHGATALCPLDCGAGEYEQDEHVDETSVSASVLVLCGHCGGRHTVTDVRRCSQTGLGNTQKESP